MKITIRYLLIIILGLASSSEAIDLTLARAIELARSHSHELKAAAMRTEAFNEALGESKAERYPTLSLDGQALYKSEITKFTIDVTPTLSINRELGSKEIYQTDLKISLPLYTGGKISGMIKVAKERLDYQKAAQQIAEDQVILSARVAYFTYSSAQWQTDAAEASLMRAETIYDDIIALHASGAADSIDILDASTALTKAKLNLETAKINRNESRINLNLMLGLNASEAVTLSDNSSELELVAALPPDNYISRAEITLSERSLEIASAAVELQKANYFPSLSAFGGYTYGKPNLDQFGNSWNDYFTVGALLKWDFNLGGRVNRSVSNARYLKRAAAHERDRVDQFLNQEAQISVERVKLAIERYENAKAIYQLAAKQYQLARVKHRLGDLTPNRVVEIEASLAEAEATRAASIANYYIAMSAYYYATASEKLREGI